MVFKAVISGMMFRERVLRRNSCLNSHCLQCNTYPKEEWLVLHASSTRRECQKPQNLDFVRTCVIKRSISPNVRH